MERHPFEPLSSIIDRLNRWDPDEARAQHVAYRRDHYQNRPVSDEDDWQPVVSRSGMIDLLPTPGAIRRALRADSGESER